MDSNRGPSGDRPNALPLGQTGSLDWNTITKFQLRLRKTIHFQTELPFLTVCAIAWSWEPYRASSLHINTLY